MKKSTFCKVLMVLALVIAVAVPVCAWAGSGTESDPYQVSSYEELKKVKDYPGAHFVQTQNIVINDPAVFEFVVPAGHDENKAENRVIAAATEAAVEWEPIKNFSGTYNGNDKYITGLYVTDDNANGGLFAEINGGTVMNVRLDFALVNSDEYAGILAGKLESGSVSDCLVSGSVIGTTTKSSNTAGGLVGYVGKDATVATSVSYATVTGATSYSANVGGLVGVNYGSVATSGYYGNVFGTATYYDAAIGGIVGYNAGNISNCRAAGTIGGESTALVNDCYVGGIAGVSKGEITNCENDSAVSVKNINSVDSLCAAGGIIGASFDTDIYDNTNKGGVSGESSYLGGIVGLAVSDSGAHYVEYNDNSGNVTSVLGVAGGIVGRAVAAGEGYVSTQINISGCYNTGTYEGNKVGELCGETGTVDDAKVIVGAEASAANSNKCSAKSLFKVTADYHQCGEKVTSKAERVSGAGGNVRSPKDEQLTDVNSNMYVTRYTMESGAFIPNSIYVENIKIQDKDKVETVDVDVSGITVEGNRISGEVVVKVYRPDTSVSYDVILGTSVGKKFADTDFAVVNGNNTLTHVRIPVDCTVEEGVTGTVSFNAIVVNATEALDPVCANVETTK